MSKLFFKGKNDSDPIFNGWSFSRTNYIFFILGILMIIIGYVIMALGETYSFQSLSLAPILLAIGYLIIIPSALIYKDKDNI